MIPVIIKIEPGAKIPEYKTSGSAGADVFAFLEKNICIQPGSTELISTGTYIQIPEGYEAQIRPRSGLALNHGLSIMNTPGTIDSDYRGEIKIILTNHGKEDFIVQNGMRIAQIVFNNIYRAKFIKESDLDSTERGSGGFGHSGV